MATLKQITANQRNALRSCGPKTAEGKARSRLNALKHGLAGDGAVSDGLIGADASYRDRHAAWDGGERPEVTDRAFAFGRMVRASLRIERAELHFERVVADQGRQARANWDIDRRIEATRLARRLPDEPEVVALELEATRHGCQVMIDRWGRLGDLLDARGSWSEAERGHALDLLGVAHEFRGGPTRLDKAGEKAKEDTLDVIRAELRRLEDRLSGPLDELDRVRKADACAGLTAEETPAGKLALRYEREAWGRYRFARRDVERFEAADLRDFEADLVRDDPPLPPEVSGPEPDPGPVQPGPTPPGPTPSPHPGRPDPTPVDAPVPTGREAARPTSNPIHRARFRQMAALLDPVQTIGVGPIVGRTRPAETNPFDELRRRADIGGRRR